MAELAPGTYRFDDLAVGDFFRTGEAEITGDLIDRFAEVSGDRFEIHLSREAALRHGFAERVAHGLLVLVLTDGLKNNSGIWLDAQASLGWDQSFTAPVLVGDRITCRAEIVEKRPIRDPARGILKIAVDVTNQDGTTVLKGTNLLMVYR